MSYSKFRVGLMQQEREESHSPLRHLLLLCALFQGKRGGEREDWEKMKSRERERE